MLITSQNLLVNSLITWLKKIFSNPFLLLSLGIVAFITFSITYRIDIPSLVASTAGAFFGTASAFLFNITDAQNRARSENRAALKKAEYLINKIFTNNEEINSYICHCLKKRNSTICEWEKIGFYDNFFAIPEIEIKSLLFLIEHIKEYSLFYTTFKVDKKILHAIPSYSPTGYILTDDNALYYVEKARNKLKKLKTEEKSILKLKQQFAEPLEKIKSQQSAPLSILIESLSLEQLQTISTLTGYTTNILDNILLVYAKNKDLLHILGERNKKYGFYIDKTENATYKTDQELKNLLGERIYLDIETLTQRFVDCSKDLAKHCKVAADDIHEFLKNY